MRITNLRKEAKAISKNTSIILSGDLENFVQSQIESGYYGSVSDVIRAGLRLLEEQSVKLAKLREELSKGETGEGVSINDYKAQFAEKRSEYLSQQGISE